MPALNLTDRTAVLAFLTAQLPSVNPTLIETLLDASAGESCAEPPVVTYRPWWVMANALQSQVGLFERVRSAAGSEVVYANQGTAIRALMNRQAAFDASLCMIPEGFEPVPAGAPGSAPLVRRYG